MKKFITVFLSSLLNCLALAQQYNNWYFGNSSGISFNPGRPTLPYVLTDGRHSLYEGSATISDAAGNLLFYTNGQKVYNRDHAEMLNGTGLLGNSSAVQSSIIVPMPNHDSIYYLFTTDAVENGLANGYRYSIINMNRAGGKGEVVTKNVLLNANCTERLTAARHANGVDVWIIGNEKNSNVFKAWLLTCTGLQPNPVVSAVGTVMTDEGMGMIKVSPDGSLFCHTSYLGLFESPFQLFDFDKATGILSNARTITNTNTAYYSCEFSPDSRLLYVTRVTDQVIDQFEVKLGTPAAINLSRVTIPADFNFYGIQTGPDGKIYLNNYSQKISVINFPDVKGTGCSYESGKLDLGRLDGALGLPSAINDGPVDPANNFTWQIIDSCSGVVQFFGQTNVGGSISWTWDFGDGTTSTLQNPQHVFPAISQYYTVKLVISIAGLCGSIERVKSVAPAGVVIKPEFEAISKCDSGYVRFVNNSLNDHTDPSIRYEWSFGDGSISTEVNPVHTYGTAGVFDITLKILSGKPCLDKSTTKSLNLQPLDIQAPPDQAIEPGQSVQLSVTGGGNHFEWKPSLWLNDATIANPVATPQNHVTYVVTATNDAGCKDSDSVRIHVNLAYGVYVPTAFSPGNDGLNDLLMPLLSRHFTLERFTVFNRWGQTVFSTSVEGKGWDGKMNGIPQSNGVYVWFCIVKDDAGNKRQLKGTVTIVR